jgi:hypothetical protein
VIASPLSLVRIEDLRRGRYYITLGKSTGLRPLRFQLLGKSKEVDRRHLIPLPLGRDVVREFYESAHRSKVVEWEDGDLGAENANG